MSKEVTFVGLKSCDTCRKARRWLDSQGIDYEYQDVREQGLAKPDLLDWCQQLGWDSVVNRRSTTWRQLPEQDREISETAEAVELLLAHPTLLKRPVLITPQGLTLGFLEAEYAQLFSHD